MLTFTFPWFVAEPTVTQMWPGNGEYDLIGCLFRRPNLSSSLDGHTVCNSPLQTPSSLYSRGWLTCNYFQWIDEELTWQCVCSPPGSLCPPQWLCHTALCTSHTQPSQRTQLGWTQKERGYTLETNATSSLSHLHYIDCMMVPWYNFHGRKSSLT